MEKLTELQRLEMLENAETWIITILLFVVAHLVYKIYQNTRIKKRLNAVYILVYQINKNNKLQENPTKIGATQLVDNIMQNTINSKKRNMVKKHDHACKQCSQPFRSVKKHSLFCSHTCYRKFRANVYKKNGGVNAN